MAALSVGWSELEFSRGQFRTAKQAAFFAMRLGIAGGNVRIFLDGLVAGKSEDDAIEEIDMAFAAMRALEFSIPTVLSATQDLTNVALGRLKREPVSYLNYVFALQNLFVDPTLKALDEYGLPIPFSQRLFAARGVPVDLDAAVDIVRRLRDGALPTRGVDDRALLLLKNFV